MLKKLLQNQQNLKAGGIYSYTGIYFFKSAAKLKLYFRLADIFQDTQAVHPESR